VNDSRLFLGIDGGGSGTRVLVIDAAGAVAGRGAAGPSNPNQVGWEGVANAIRDAVAASGVAGPFAGVHAGIAGVATPEARAKVCTVLAELGFGAPGVTSAGHDLEIALAGGLSGRPGIVLVAGTGSACFGRNTRGDSWQAGGWGPVLDDAGGGYWLGLRAIMTAIRAEDGRGPATTLRTVVLGATGALTLRDVLAMIQDGSLERQTIAALAPQVIGAAQRKDPSAQVVVALGAAELGLMVGAVATKLAVAAGEVEITVTGGVGASVVYGAVVEAAVKKRVQGARFTKPELSAVAGAAILAATRGGAADPSAALRSAGG
jgi:N-acetylglucosamine kinase-like BadF-type ATPase